MNEISSFVLKKSDLFLLLKKIDFSLSKYRSILWDVKKKKVVFDDKNSDMFCYI